MLIGHELQKEIVNLKHVTKIKFLDEMDAAQVGYGTTLNNYEEGHAYIQFSLIDGSDVYWAFPEEKDGKNVFKRISVLDTKDKIF